MTVILLTVFKCIWCLNHDNLILVALEFVPSLQATQVSIGLDNGLVPTMRLVIIWTDGDQVYWRKHAPCRLNEVKWVKYSGLPALTPAFLKKTLYVVIPP